MLSRAGMIESAGKRSRRAPTGLSLLTAGENKLREGNVRAALEMFRRVVDRCPPSLERLAALAYLRST